MAVTPSPRWGFPIPDSGTDPFPGRSGFTQIWEALEASGAKVELFEGTDPPDPDPAEAGRFLLGDFGFMFLDMGTELRRLIWAPEEFGSPNEDGSASPGNSPYAARVDHRHDRSHSFHRTRLRPKSGAASAGAGRYKFDSGDQTRDLTGFAYVPDEWLTTQQTLRTGTYLANVTVQLDGIPDPSSWRTHPISLAVFKNNVLYAAKTIPAVAAGPMPNQRIQELTVHIPLAVNDLIGFGLWLHSEVTDTPGVVAANSHVAMTIVDRIHGAAV